MPTLIPYLTFHRGQQSLRFLSAGLGFEILVVQYGVGGAIAHAELRRGDALLMGGSGEPEPGATPGLYLVSADVDEEFRRAVAAGAEVVYGPEETEWGTKRARLRDPDGYEWSIGTYQPGQGSC